MAKNKEWIQLEETFGVSLTKEDYEAYRDYINEKDYPIVTTFRAGDTAFFTCSDRESGIENKKVTVLRPLSSHEADIFDVGIMYKVRLADGTLMDAFDDELSVDLDTMDGESEDAFCSNENEEYSYDVHEMPWTPPKNYSGYVTYVDEIKWKDPAEDLPKAVAIEGEIYDGEEMYELLEGVFDAEVESYGHKPTYESY